MKPAEHSLFDSKVLGTVLGGACRTQTPRKNDVIFAQGDPADSVFCVQRGTVKLAIVSPRGKEAVIAILGDGSFFGEGCLAGQLVRAASAIALTECSVVQIEHSRMLQVLHDAPEFSALFTAHLLKRNIRIEEDLIDHLFNTSEKRLARTLLLLAAPGQGARSDDVIPNMSQETLAEMVGTTRSRVSFFLNKFRKLGFIDYDRDIRVHRSLLNVIHDDRTMRAEARTARTSFRSPHLRDEWSEEPRSAPSSRN